MSQKWTVRRIGGRSGADFLASDVDADVGVEARQVVGERRGERLPRGLGGGSEAGPRLGGGGEPLTLGGLDRQWTDFWA